MELLEPNEQDELDEGPVNWWNEEFPDWGFTAKWANQYLTPEQQKKLNRYGWEILEDMRSCTPKKLEQWAKDGTLFKTVWETGDHMLRQFLTLIDMGYDEYQATEVIREEKYQITGYDLGEEDEE